MPILHSIFDKNFLSISYLRFPTFQGENGTPNSGFSSYFYLGLIRMEIAQYLKLKDSPTIFFFRKTFFLAVNFLEIDQHLRFPLPEILSIKEKTKQNFTEKIDPAILLLSAYKNV